MRYRNPILPGFYPDPSICKKGDDFYLVTSSFEFFPGVPIFHSRDLVNWTQIGHCLTRASQLPLEGAACSKGIYAATIRYNPFDDFFYMVTTNTTLLGNFYVRAKDPAGEWSEPIRVDQGGIDPSLFFDEDGSAHFISNARLTSESQAGFLMAPIDLATGRFLRPPQPVWGGIGEAAPEAPHIYKREGWYYQVNAEGGTELGHMVTIARARDLYGPYESCPHNPILTHRPQKRRLIQATGHADLIQDNAGNWWAVFLGYRQTHQFFHHLGRETFLAPVEWAEGWPVINGGRPIETWMESDRLPSGGQRRERVYQAAFAGAPDFNWVHLRNPDPSNYAYGPQGAALFGNACTLSDLGNPAFLGFRQKDLQGSASVRLSFAPQQEGEEAGLSIYYKSDAHLDACLLREAGQTWLCFRKVVGDIVHMQSRQTFAGNALALELAFDALQYHVYALVGGERLHLGDALTRHVSTEAHELGFTGVLLALYATGNGRAAGVPAQFTDFQYRGQDE